MTQYLKISPALACCLHVAAYGVLLAACTSPPLKLYTLTELPPSSSNLGLEQARLVIEVPRIAIPDYLDTEDILLRRGTIIQRSAQGRLITRLSVGMTDLIASDIGARLPNALVTTVPQGDAPAYRIEITVSRLDVTADGTAVLDADWVILPIASSVTPPHNRAHLTQSGSVANDQDIVQIEQILFDRLAARIDISCLR